MIIFYKININRLKYFTLLFLKDEGRNIFRNGTITLYGTKIITGNDDLYMHINVKKLP